MTNRRPRTGLTNDSLNGRVLMALRAGRMSIGELRERFSSSNLAMGALVKQGLVTQLGDADKGKYFEITEAGRIACPNRNPESTTPRSAPPGAISGSRKPPIF